MAQQSASALLAAYFHQHHHDGMSTRPPPLYEADEGDAAVVVHPNREQLTRRHALTPHDQRAHEQQAASSSCGTTDGCCASDNVIIVPHVQISQSESLVHNRAISSGGGMLADLQRATIAAQAFYAEQPEPPKSRSPWILKRLYEWSGRAKRREMVRHVRAALETPPDHEFEDEDLEKLMPVTWEEMFAPSASPFAEDKEEKPTKKEPDAAIPRELEMTPQQVRYLTAVWELFHSELSFLFRQLLVLRNVYKEPLKKCQVEGCLLSVEPDLLFGNLDQLCRISRNFCQTFLSLLKGVTSSATAVQLGPASYNLTDLVVQLFERFSKGPSTISAYQAYCINYKATMEYLASVRNKEERFAEFERICLTDERCERLQLEDLLISPLQRITRLPILLREILRYTEADADKSRVERVIEQMTESLRSIDDSVQWLHNFERLQQLQQQVIWPSIAELEPRSFIPDFLRVALSRQFCENLLAHPRRKLIHEGHLEFVENGKTSDCYAFLFNDMFIVAKAKKCGSKMRALTKQSSGFFQKVNSGSSAGMQGGGGGGPGGSGSVSSSSGGVSGGIGMVGGGSIGAMGPGGGGGSIGSMIGQHYVVLKQPVPLDSCVFCDADSSAQHNGQTNGGGSSSGSSSNGGSQSLRHAFVIIHLTRYYQVVSIYTLQAADARDKQLWIEKFQESIENYESIQLKDMLKCTPLFSSLSLRRCSSSRLMSSTTNNSATPAGNYAESPCPQQGGGSTA